MNSMGDPGLLAVGKASLRAKYINPLYMNTQTSNNLLGINSVNYNEANPCLMNI